MYIYIYIHTYVDRENYLTLEMRNDRGRRRAGSGDRPLCGGGIYTYIYIYIHTYIHTYTHTYTYTWIHICIYTYVHIYIYTYIHIHILYIHVLYIHILYTHILYIHILNTTATLNKLDLFWKKAPVSTTWKLRVRDAVITSKLSYGLESESLTQMLNTRDWIHFR